MYLLIDINFNHFILSENKLKKYCLTRLANHNVKTIMSTFDGEDYEIYLADDPDLEVEDLIRELLNYEHFKIFSGDNLIELVDL